MPSKTATSDPQARVEAARADLADALKGHDAAEQALRQAKERCFDACGAATEATRAARADLEDAEVKACLEAAGKGDLSHPLALAVVTEERTHDEHRDELEAAYAEFGKVAVAESRLARALRGLEPLPTSNPAKPGVTPISAAVVVTAEAQGG